MVKKYKLTDSNIKNQKAGAGFNFTYPIIPNMTGLIPSNSYGSYIRPGSHGGIKFGIPLVNNNGDGVKMIIPQGLDPRDPSVFIGVDSKPTTGPIKNVNLTFKEAMPKQSIVMYQPNLPIIPNSFGIQYPVGLQPGAPILINPTDSKARMEISSNESDDIMTISGEQDKIKPIFEGIQKNNKVKIAQDEVTLAKKEFVDAHRSAVPPTGKYYNSDYKRHTIDVLESMNAVMLPLSIRKQVLKLKKAQNALKEAKKEASMPNNDDDVPSANLISLDTLFDLNKVIRIIKTKFRLASTEFEAKSSKKNSLQLLLGIPYRNGINYGPTIY